MRCSDFFAYTRRSLRAGVVAPGRRCFIDQRAAGVVGVFFFYFLQWCS